MITSIFLRHFKIYKGITFIPISEECGFSSLIGENGVGKSSVLEALDFAINKKNNGDWPVNNEAKTEGGLSGSNIPFIAPVFLLHKDILKQSKKEDLEHFEKAIKLSQFLWNTKIKTKTSALDDFYKHRDELKRNFNEEDYLLLLVGKKYNEAGIFFGSYHNSLDFISDDPLAKPDEEATQKYFKGFFEYIISHYSYIYIPVDTDVYTYTKLETQDMQKLMDKNIQSAIEDAIKVSTLKQINKDLDNFIKDIESVLEIYEYRGHFKNNLTMPDLVSKIIEAYFSIKVLNKKTENDSKRIPVSELSSGEKRKALIDVAYSFLLKNKDRKSNIILAIDEPEASLHISACYSQFEKLINISRLNHQIIVSTHWYGYLPIVTHGSATSIKKAEGNEITIEYFNLYNYREKLTQARRTIKGALPVDYSIKSYNDLIQSIVFSLIQEKPYNWIICEGLSEKIYFEEIFKKEIEENHLRVLPMGSYKEVKKVYNYLLSPIKDPDYKIKGKVICIIDTDIERVDVECETVKNLYFYRLLNSEKDGSTLVEVSSNLTSPQTEIEDCLNPHFFHETLLGFSEEYEEIERILSNSVFNEGARNSAEFLDLRESERKSIKSFFDGNEGYNKIRFAKKYVDAMKKGSSKYTKPLNWTDEIKKRIKNP